MGINPYGLTVGLAVFLGCFLTAERCRRRGLPADFVWESLPWVVSFGLLGARLYHIINFLPFYLESPILIPQIWRGGLGIYGALLGGFLGLFLKVKIQNSKVKDTGQNSKLSVLNYLDAAAPGIALAQAVGRVGNVLNGENLPFSYWEMVLNLLIFLLLLLVERWPISGSRITNFQFPIFKQNSKFQILKTGSSFTGYLLLYSFGRFLLEFFRSDSPWVAGPLTMAQWVSLALIALVILINLRPKHLLL